MRYCTSKQWLCFFSPHVAPTSPLNLKTSDDSFGVAPSSPLNVTTSDDSFGVAPSSPLNVKTPDDSFGVAPSSPLYVKTSDDSFGVAPFTPLNVKTPDDSFDVKIQDVTSTSVTVTWKPPQNVNGILLGYEVSYTPNGGAQTAVEVQNSTTWKLSDMKPFTSYSISVRAKTLAGYGEKCSPVIVSTLESGMLLIWLYSLAH